MTDDRTGTRSWRRLGQPSGSATGDPARDTIGARPGRPPGPRRPQAGHSGPARRPGSPDNAGQRLPSPPRQRRPALAALAVLLIVGGAAIAGLLALRADSRVPVLVARHDIAVGARITRDDLAVARIAGENVKYVRTSRVGSGRGPVRQPEHLPPAS